MSEVSLTSTLSAGDVPFENGTERSSCSAWTPVLAGRFHRHVLTAAAREDRGILPVIPQEELYVTPNHLPPSLHIFP